VLVGVCVVVGDGVTAAVPVCVGVGVWVEVVVGVGVLDAVGVGVISPRHSTQVFQGPLKIVAVSAKLVSKPGTIE
jgi:hypothetical protein